MEDFLICWNTWRSEILNRAPGTNLPCGTDSYDLFKCSSLLFRNFTRQFCHEILMTLKRICSFPAEFENRMNWTHLSRKSSIFLGASNLGMKLDCCFTSFIRSTNLPSIWCLAAHISFTAKTCTNKTEHSYEIWSEAETQGTRVMHACICKCLSEAWWCAQCECSSKLTTTEATYDIDALWAQPSLKHN